MTHELLQVIRGSANLTEVIASYLLPMDQKSTVRIALVKEAEAMYLSTAGVDTDNADDVEEALANGTWEDSDGDLVNLRWANLTNEVKELTKPVSEFYVNVTDADGENGTIYKVTHPDSSEERFYLDWKECNDKALMDQDEDEDILDITLSMMGGNSWNMEVINAFSSVEYGD